jgi:hypothetical protein
MSVLGPASFGYSIVKVGDEWRWTAFDRAGCVKRHGGAPSRAAAAAQVVRVLAEDALAQENRAA